MDTLISVLIPCYNHEKFIADCLDSLIAQSYPNIELLIIDDASVDRSWDVIKSYERQLKCRFVNLVLERNSKNLGLTHNLNKLVQLAKGDIIKVLASDDFLDVHYFEAVNGLYLEKTPDLIMTNAFLVKEESTFREPKIIREFYPSNPFDTLGRKRLFESIFKVNFLCAPSISLNKRLYEQYGMYDESLSVEDFDYWLNITKDDSIRCAYCEEPLVFYRQNECSMSSSFKGNNYENRMIKMHDNCMMTMLKYKQYLSKNKYNLYMLRMILHYYKISKVDSLFDLRRKCFMDKKLIDYPYRVLFIFLA